MDCTRCREILSARLDGEEVGASGAMADAHVAGCAGCAHFLEESTELHRNLRVRPAESVPDLANAIVAAAPDFGRRRSLSDRLATWSGARIVLASLGVALLVLALPTMVFHTTGGQELHHLTRELAAFQVALGGGFLLAARDPNRTAGLLPVAAMLVAAMVTIALVDLGHGHAPTMAEGQHVLEVIGVALLWKVDRDVRGAAPAPHRPLGTV
jgi:predicted anti-sigma-YlaC factor YlaD